MLHCWSAQGEQCPPAAVPFLGWALSLLPEPTTLEYGVLMPSGGAALLLPLLFGRGDGTWPAPLLLPSATTAPAGGGHSCPLPHSCLGRHFSLAGLGMGSKLLPPGEVIRSPECKVAVGHPRLRSLGCMRGKPGPCGGSQPVLWLLVARRWPAGLRVAKAGWRPRVPGETAWDGGQSGCEELVRNAAGGLHHHLPLPAGSAGPWEQLPRGRDISTPQGAGGRP